jgi:GNAT superfamily N-acetyltransferase
VDSGAVLASFDQQMRRDARPDGPDARVERGDDVVRQVGANAGWSGVVWSNLDDGGADAAIAAQVRYFTSLDQEFEWKLYAHDRPADLAERLRRAGFAAEPPETLMVAELAALATKVELPDGVDLRLVIDPEAADLVVDVHEQAFGADGSRFRSRIRAQLAERPDEVAVVLAMAGDVPVCAARLEMLPGTDFASLWGGGTLPSWRGRGIYRATVAFRARIAAERGYRYLQVDASDQSRPILTRLGFVTLSTTTPYVYEP